MRRERGVFVSHPCLDCLREIRWESYRCYECHAKWREEFEDNVERKGGRPTEMICRCCGRLKEPRPDKPTHFRCRLCHGKRHHTHAVG